MVEDICKDKFLVFLFLTVCEHFQQEAAEAFFLNLLLVCAQKCTVGGGKGGGRGVLVRGPAWPSHARVTFGRRCCIMSRAMRKRPRQITQSFFWCFFFVFVFFLVERI